MVLLGLHLTSAQLMAQTKKPETNKDKILKEMEHVLDQSFALWYPLSVDTTDGGFYSDIDYRWQLKGKQNKSG